MCTLIIIRPLNENTDTLTLGLVKFHSTINMSDKINRKDKLLSYIHIIISIRDKSRNVNDDDSGKFPVF